MKLAFSTLACPDWDWRTAIARCAAYGYDGIEWRLVDGQTVPSDFPLEVGAEIRQAVQAANLETCALDSGVRLAQAPGEERDQQIRDGRALLRVAKAMGAPMLRLFPGTYPEAVSDEQALTWMLETLAPLIPEAQAAGVKLTLEVHDSFTWDRKRKRGTTSSMMAARVSAAAHAPEVGILWDLGNPYLEGDSAAESWAQVSGQVNFVHAKDMRRKASGEWEYVLPGEGVIPLADVFRWLHGSGYDGWVSVEWEKKWHPEIAEPDVALPSYLSALRAYLA